MKAVAVLFVTGALALPATLGIAIGSVASGSNGDRIVLGGDLTPVFFLHLELVSNQLEGRTDEAEAVSEEQIIGILQEAEAGAVVTELYRKHAMSSPRSSPMKPSSA